MNDDSTHKLTIPSKFYKFVDLKYKFSIHECTRTTGIEFLDNGTKRAAYFDGNKLHPWAKHLAIPESVYVNCQLKSKTIHFLISKKYDIKLFDAVIYYRHSILAGPRTNKYLTLYKAYESITPKNNRNLTFSSIRHSLSHSPSHLTKPNVVKKLTELFGGFEVNLNKYNHCKVFHVAYWNMLIQTDIAINEKLQSELKNTELYLGTFRLLK